VDQAVKLLRARDGMVTVFWPLMTVGAGIFVDQRAVEVKSVVDCKANPTALVDQAK
jgi:hypothetical protein